MQKYKYRSIKLTSIIKKKKIWLNKYDQVKLKK